MWNASKGASLAMSIAMVSAVILLLVFDSGIIAQPEPTAFLVGLPIMFFGSSLLPWLASATTLALDIVDPETREGVLSRVSAIPESFIILTLALSTGSRPPRQIILRSLTWTLTILVLPLAMGWLLVARVVGPISWIIPPIYYGLLLWFTNRQIHLIASRDLETLSASIRPMPVPPGPSSRSEIAWLIFILIFYGYLLISILRSPFL